jgi:hypothetical protein
MRISGPRLEVFSTCCMVLEKLVEADRTNIVNYLQYWIIEPAFQDVGKRLYICIAQKQW